jgi:hypothetical protein
MWSVFAPISFEKGDQDKGLGTGSYGGRWPQRVEEGTRGNETERKGKRTKVTVEGSSYVTLSEAHRTHLRTVHRNSGIQKSLQVLNSDGGGGKGGWEAFISYSKATF